MQSVRLYDNAIRKNRNQWNEKLRILKSYYRDACTETMETRLIQVIVKKLSDLLFQTITTNNSATVPMKIQSVTIFM